MIPLPDGTVKKLKIVDSIFDYIPRVYIDEERIQIVRKLEWYEKFLVGMPFLFVFAGGYLGAIGVISIFMAVENLKALRSTGTLRNKIVRITINSVLPVLVKIFFDFIYA